MRLHVTHISVKPPHLHTGRMHTIYEYCSTYVVWILSKVQYAYYGSRVILVYLVVCAMHTLHSTRDLMHNTLGSIMHYTINLVLASSITTLE